MFIDPQNTPGFKRSIFNAIVAPRPIGWISTISAQGVAYLAPFSQFNLVFTAPPVVMFACNTPADRAEKDTITNVRATGEFAVNLVSWDLRQAMNTSSTPAPHGIDEFVLGGLAKEACVKVGAPRVAASPASLECRVLRMIEIAAEDPGDTRSTVVFGKVVGLHIAEAFLRADGRFNTIKAQPTTRLGGIQYATVGDVVEMPAPFVRNE